MPTVGSRRRAGPGSRWSLARQLVILQVTLVVLTLGAATAWAVVDADQQVEDQAERRVLVVASTIADMPAVVDAVQSDDPSAILQPIAVRIQTDTGVDFVTIMDLEGIRYTHRDPQQIGQRFLGTIDAALRGDIVNETYKGTLGESIRVVVPIRDGSAGPVVALVSVGVTLAGIDTETAGRIWALVLGAAAVLALALFGTWLIGRRVDRVTHRMGPGELALMYEHYDAVLHSVREGLLLLDNDGRVGLLNAEAHRLLDVSDAAVGKLVTDIGLPDDVAAALNARDRVIDQLQVSGDRVLVVNSLPTRSPVNGRVLGRVVTLRDHTELTSLASELGVAKDLTEALKSQAHEAANRLHVVVGLVETGNTAAAIEFATEELQVAQRLNDQVVGAVSDPLIASVLLGKAQTAAERGVELQVAPDSELDSDVLADADIALRDVVTVLTNLIDNAVDAVAGTAEGAGKGTGWVRVTVRRSEPDLDELLIRVADNGPGIAEDQLAQVFSRGYSTKPATDAPQGRGLGLALVSQVVRRYGGVIEVTGEGGATFTVVIGRGRSGDGATVAGSGAERRVVSSLPLPTGPA